MPYSSLTATPPSWRQLSASAGGSDKIPLSLSQVNYIAHVYDALVAQGKTKPQAASIAITQFRSTYKVKNNMWVKKDLSAPQNPSTETFKTSFSGSIRFDAPFTIAKHYSVMEDVLKEDGSTEPEEHWYVEGKAIIDKLDYQKDIVSPLAMKNALSDLDVNSTVLYNHIGQYEIGAITMYKFLGDSIWIKVRISKTRPEIWKRVTEGIIKKLSLRGQVLAFELIYVPELRYTVRFVKAMTINEISLVTVSGQRDTTIQWYVEKADDPISASISKAFEHQTEGGEIPMKIARTPDTPETTAATVPFTIQKSEDGSQTLTIQVPEGLSKSDAGNPVNLEVIEKAIKENASNIDAILKATATVPTDADDVVKNLFAQVKTAAEALQKGGLATLEKDAATTPVPGSGNTIQIVLPPTTIAKADSVVTPEPTAKEIADPIFQKSLLDHMQKGLTFLEAVGKTRVDVLAKASPDVTLDATNDLVKALMAQVTQKDAVAHTAVNTAVAQLAEIVSAQSVQIDTLKKSIDNLPLRKGAHLSEQEITQKRAELEKSLEGKDPREQLSTLLSMACSTANVQ